MSRPGTFLSQLGDHDERVEAVGDGHGLGAVSDEVSRDEGVLHADVAHGDAVAHRDGWEDDGHAARHGHTPILTASTILSMFIWPGTISL